jgi:hypothetical protein
MSSQCDTGRLKKNIPAAMIATIAATSMSAVNPCGNAAALEVTDDRTECEREEARWFARTYERRRFKIQRHRASADQVITG